MRFQDIQKLAKKQGINTFRMNKGQIVRAIQAAEGNPICYGTEKANQCREQACLWRTDCFSTTSAAGASQTV